MARMMDWCDGRPPLSRPFLMMTLLRYCMSLSKDFICPSNMHNQAIPRVSLVISVSAPSINYPFGFFSNVGPGLENDLGHDSSDHGKLQLQKHVWIQLAALFRREAHPRQCITYLNVPIPCHLFPQPFGKIIRCHGLYRILPHSFKYRHIRV